MTQLASGGLVAVKRPRWSVELSDVLARSGGQDERVDWLPASTEHKFASRRLSD
jgi:hypothetical protein